MLTVALSEYFSSDVHVQIFGSSSTSLGTKDSDIVCCTLIPIFSDQLQLGSA